MQHTDHKPDFTPRVLISHCLRAASIVCQVRRDLLMSDARSPDVVRARSFGMAVALALTEQTPPAIGRGFGGKDRTTVVEAIRRADHLGSVDADAARTMREIAAKARDLAGVWPRDSGLPVADEVRRPTLPRIPSLARPSITDDTRREMRKLRAKGWSVNGLAKRYGIDVEQVYCELGEQSPRSAAA